MPRDYKVSLDDILEAINRIESYTTGLGEAQFQADRKTFLRHHFLPRADTNSFPD